MNDSTNETDSGFMNETCEQWETDTNEGHLL